MDKGAIRPFEEKDREAIRRICRDTGLRGKPTHLFFEDEEITPLLFVDYYLDYEPENCFVAEVGGRVVGYQVGSLDTRRQERIMRTRVYPRVILHLLRNLMGFRYRKKETYRTLWWIISCSWREAVIKPPLDRYPAHAHWNIEEGYRGEGLGRRLGNAFRRNALARGVRGMHAIVREPEGDESLSSFFCRERGYRIADIRRSTVWEKATGRIWYTRLIVCDLKPIPEEAVDAPEGR
jgi:hypothetical protein